MTFDSRFGSADVLRRLGISNPRHYAVGDAPLQGTIQILDLSRSIAQEPVEARGYKWTSLFGHVGFGYISLNAINGGILLERLELEAPLGFDQASFTVAPIDPNAVIITTLIPLDVGGVATKATIWQAATLVDRPTPPNWEGFDQAAVRDSRIYIPPGFRFSIQSHTLNGTITLAMLWRELQP